jgi:thymidylate kinase
MSTDQLAKAPEIIVLDGHDGAGKTTLARLAAATLGGTYVKPFDSTLGDMIAWLCEEQGFELADELSRASIRKIMEEHTESPLLIFDRHWLSMFTLFPVKLRASWFTLPTTILCWTDLETTKARLSTRGEDPGNDAEHEHFIKLYLSLAEQFSVPIVNTTCESAEESLNRIMKLTQKQLS